jgi:RNA polymerase sigma-70 factor (ECF subfamily)
MRSFFIEKNDSRSLCPVSYKRPQRCIGPVGRRTVVIHAAQKQKLPCTDTCESTAGDYDIHLLRRFQRGDLSAFEQLVERHKQSVINYAARTIRDPTEAEDIAQKAFVRVFSASARFRFQANFSTWLFAITRNLCLNELRRRARHRTEPLEHDNDGERPWTTRAELTSNSTAEESLLRSELVAKLDEALAALPERQRTAILLLRESKISYENIAAILGTTIPATKSLIYNGRNKLKRILRPYLHRTQQKAVVAEKRRIVQSGGTTHHSQIQ